MHGLSDHFTIDVPFTRSTDDARFSEKTKVHIFFILELKWSKISDKILRKKKPVYQ